jgi:Mrp family chromosome partitioning ATPase
MTSTDRAFIAALQKASATAPSLGGPHYAMAAPFASPKGAAPLSAQLARRRTPAPQPAPPPAVIASEGPFAAGVPFSPGVEVEALTWPPVAQQLAHAGRDALIDLLSTLAHRRPEATPRVAVVGVRPGVGATTLLLALARVVGSVGGSTAIIDLTSPTGAAAQLGVRRGAHHQDAFSIDELTVHSREDELSIVALGHDVTPRLVAAACARLAVSHDLVLIDAGGPADSAPLLGAGVQLLLADTTPSDPAAIAAAQSQLADAAADGIDVAGLDVAGIVETFAPLA